MSQTRTSVGSKASVSGSAPFDTQSMIWTYLAKGVTFIQMEVTLHEDTGCVLNRPKHQTTLMSLN